MTVWYSEKLKDPRWQKKRLRIFERDGWACRDCGSTMATLNVHHAFYKSGKNPWEYPSKSLLTLCEACHKIREDAKKLPARSVDSVSPDLFLMLSVAVCRECYPLVRDAGIGFSDLEDDRALALFVALEEALQAQETSLERLCARLEDPKLRDLVVRKISSGEFDLNQEQMVVDGVRRIRQRNLIRRRDSLGIELKQAEHGHPDRLMDLLSEKMRLDDALRGQ